MMAIQWITDRHWNIAMLVAIVLLGAIDLLWSRPAADALTGARQTHQSKTLHTAREAFNDHPPSASDSAQRFVSVLHQSEGLRDWALILNHLPKAHHLAAGHVRYETLNDSDIGLSFHRVHLPLTGSFPNMVGFLDALKTKIPATRIESLQMSSTHAKSNAVNIHLVVSIPALPKLATRGTDAFNMASASNTRQQTIDPYERRE